MYSKYNLFSSSRLSIALATVLSFFTLDSVAQVTISGGTGGEHICFLQSATLSNITIAETNVNDIGFGSSGFIDQTIIITPSSLSLQFDPTQGSAYVTGGGLSLGFSITSTAITLTLSDNSSTGETVINNIILSDIKIKSVTSVVQGQNLARTGGTLDVDGLIIGTSIATIGSVPPVSVSIAGTNQTQCNNGNFTLAGNNPTNGTGIWTIVGASNGAIIANPASNTSAVTGLTTGSSVTLRWTITNGTCTPSTSDLTLTNVALPSTAIAGTDQIKCNNGNFTLEGNNPTSGTGIWTIVGASNGATIANSASNTSTVTGLTVGNSVTLRWTITNGTCTASADDVVLRNDALPSTAIAGTDQTKCNNGNFTLSGNNPTSGSGTWSIVGATNGATITTPTSPTSTVTGLTAGKSVTLRWSINNGTCLPSTDEVTLTNNALPSDAMAGADQAQCNNGTFTLAGNKPNSGSGLWSFVGADHGASITDATNHATTVTGLTVGNSVTLRWTITNGTCTASADDVVLRNDALPSTAIAGTDQTKCNNGNFTLSGNNPTSGSGTWSIVGATNGATITTPTSPTSTVTGLTAGKSVTLRWSINNGTCLPSTDEVTLTNNALPSDAMAGADQAQCNNGTFTLAGNKPNSGSGLWSFVGADHGASITDATNHATTVTGLTVGNSVTLRWTITNGTCTASADDVVLRNDALPSTAIAGTDQTKCNNGNFTLSGNNPTSGSGTWSIVGATNGATITTPTSPTSTVTGLTAGKSVTLRWSINNGTCLPSTDEVTLTNNALPSDAMAGADQAQCNNGTFTLAGNKPNSGSGLWSFVGADHGASITDATNHATTVTGLTVGNSVTLRWTITNGTCTASADDVVLRNDALPSTAIAGTDQTKCNNGNFTLSGNNPTSGSGTWSIVGATNGATITTPTSPTSTVTGLTAGKSVTLRWSINNGTCLPSTDEVTLTNNALPSDAMAGADQAQCNNGTFTLAGNKPNSGSGLWSFVGADHGASITDATNHATTVTGLTVGNSVTLRWTITNGTCTASADDVVLRNDALPSTAIAGTDQTKCNNGNFTLSGNNPTSGSGTWSIVGATNGATITTPTSPTSTVTGLTAGKSVTLRWSINNGTCLPSTDEVTLTNNALPSDAMAGADQAQCNNGTFTLAGNKPNSGSGLWSFVGADHGASITDATNHATTVTGLTVGNSVTLRWTITNGTCTASADDVVLRNDALPSTAIAGTDQTKCNNGNFTLSGNNPTSGSGTWSIVGVANGATITTPTSATSTVTGLTAGKSVTLRWSINNGTCLPSTDEVTLTNNALPSDAMAGADQAQCNNGTFTLAGNKPDSGSGTWNIVNPSNGASITDTSDRTSTVTGLTADKSVTLRWTITNGTCTASADDVVLRNDALPSTAIAGTDQTKCNNGNFTLSGNNPTSGSGTWSIVGVANGATITTPTSATSTVTGLTAGKSVTLRWSINNGTCLPSTDEVTLTNNALPSDAMAGADQAQCNNGTFTLAGNKPNSGSGLWSFVGADHGASITDATNHATTVTGLTVGNSVTFRWTITSGSCTASTDMVTLTNNKLPIGDISGVATICDGSSTNLIFNLTGKGPFNVAYSNGTSSFELNNIANGGNTSVTPKSTTTYRLTKVVDLGTDARCEATNLGTSVTVTVNPNPTLTITNTKSSSICSGGTTDITLNSPTPNHTITVTSMDYGAVTGGSVAVNNTFSNGNTIAETLENPTDNPITVTYGFKVTTTDGCPVGTNPEQTTRVIVAPRPDMSIANNATTICSGATTDMTLNSSEAGAVIKLTDVTGTTGVTGFTSVGVTYSDGGKITDKLVNTTNAPVTIIYEFSVSIGNCASNTPIYRTSVTINPNPMLTITNAKNSICSGGTTDITLNSPTSNHTITVTSMDYGAVTGGSVAVNSTYSNGNTIAETLENPTDNPITVTYGFKVTTTDGCPVGTNPEQTTRVIVAPRPDMSIANNATTICSGATTDMTLNSSEAGAVIKLTDVTGTTGVTGFTSVGVTYSDGGKITDKLVNTTNAPVTIIYEFSVSIGNCASNTPIYRTSVTINPNPTLTITNAKNSICSGGTTDITLNSPTSNHTITVTSMDYGAVTGGSVAVNSTYSNGNTIAETLENPTDNPITVTYGFKVTTTDGCPVGTNPEQTTRVIVAPRPDMSIANNATTICSGATTDMTLNSSEAGAVIKLTDVTGTTGVTGFTSVGVTYFDGGKITDKLVNTTNAPVTITYEFSVSIGNCASNTPIYRTSVTINPNPTLTITNAKNSICSGESTDITLKSPTNGHQIKVVRVDYGGGNITGGSISVGNTFNNNDKITETLNNTTSSSLIATYVLQVFTPSTNPTCPLTSEEKIVKVTVLPLPQASAIDQTVCSGETITIPITNAPNNVLGVTYTWTVTGTSNVSGYGNGDGSTISQKLKTTDNNIGRVTYTITPKANGCTGPNREVNVTVNPLPSVDAGADFSTCEPSTINLSGTIGGSATSGTWSLVSGGTGTVSISNTIGTTVTATYSVTQGEFGNLVFGLVTDDPDGSGPCNVATDQLTVKVNQKPTVTVSADFIVCQPTSITIKGTIGGSASSGVWSIVSGDGTLSVSSKAGNEISATYTPVATDVGKQVTFQLQTNDSDLGGPCNSASDNLNVTINQSPIISAGGDLSVCENIKEVQLQGSFGGSVNQVRWSGGAGSFNNPNLPNATYTYHPSEIGKTVTLTLTSNDPDGTGPCESIIDKMIVTVNRLPNVSFFGLPTTRAQNAGTVEIFANKEGGVFTIQPFTPALTNLPSSVGQLHRASFDPAVANVTTYTITYTYTDPNTGCKNSTNKFIEVLAVTSIDWTVDKVVSVGSTFGRQEVCAETGLLRLKGIPALTTGKAGTRFESTTPGLVTLEADGFYYMQTDRLASATYEIGYTYVNDVGAISVLNKKINVHASPKATINVANACIKDDIQFKDATTVPQSNFTNIPPFTVSVSEWDWNFDDNQTFSKAKNPKHKYSTQGIYNVELKATTEKGCTASTQKQIRVGPIPEVDFVWTSICSGDATNFVQKVQTGISTVTEYEWDFGISGDSKVTGGHGIAIQAPNNNGGRTTGTYDNPKHKYNQFGSFKVNLKIKTNDGCTKDSTKNIFILPFEVLTPTTKKAYTENFEANNGGWVASADFEGNGANQYRSDTSWVWGVPASKNINSPGNKAWWTGKNIIKNNDLNADYPESESSYVNGPCFDLTALNRPMISFDIWVDLQESFDGAVVQYSLDGGMTWLNVGTINQGLNWYNGQNIVGMTRNQLLGRYGWTKPTKKWITASFGLENIPKNKRHFVRFRVAFGTDASTPTNKTHSGFAFDNVYVGEKTKHVLFEHFTNANPGGQGTNDYIYNLFDNQQNNTNDSVNFVLLQYHLGVPVFDQLYADNEAEQNARALFYGFDKTPNSILDGLPVFSGFAPNKINSTAIDSLALKTPVFDIKIDTIRSDKNTLNIKTILKANKDFSQDLILNVAIVENQITLNGKSYRNVFRKLLYGSDGFVISNSWKIGQELQSSASWTINKKIYNAKNLAIIVFVQNRQTKEVYQAEYLKAQPKQSPPITGVNLPLNSAIKELQLYPNPVNNELTIAPPRRLEGHFTWQIVDQRGVNVLTGDMKFSSGREHKIDTSSVPNGIYYVVVGTENHPVMYRKIVVSNRN